MKVFVYCTYCCLNVIPNYSIPSKKIMEDIEMMVELLLWILAVLAVQRCPPVLIKMEMI